MSNSSKKIINLHIYRAPEHEIDVPIVDMDVWLSQKDMAQLFGVDVKTVGKHVNNVVRDDNLDDSVISKIEITATDGKKYTVNHYNLDVIVSVGYRIGSPEASRFRRWATQVIRDYATKGIAVNQRALEKLDDDALGSVATSSIKAITAAYRKLGFGEEKIRARLKGIVSRNDVTEMFKLVVRDQYKGRNPSIGRLTNETYTGLFRRTATELQEANGGLKPRDGMTSQGLDFLSAAESTIADML